MFVASVILLLVALLTDGYIWFNFLRGGAALWSALHWLPTVALVLAIALAAAGVAQDGAFRAIVLLVVCAVLPKLVFTLVSLLGRLAGLLCHGAAPVADVAGAALAIVVLGCALYGSLAGWRRLVVRPVDVAAPGLPAAFNGYCIVHISDLHLGTYASAPGAVDRIVDTINSLNADLVVFTGDIVNGYPDELTPFMERLSQIKARDGVVSVLGNHDYCMYHNYAPGDSPEKAVRRLIEAERRMGWQLLLNQHITLHRGADSIAVVGVENSSRPPFPDRGDLPKAIGPHPCPYSIVLTHDPSHWRRAVLPTTGAQLTLSGHTHAMQLKIGGFSPSQWIYPEWGGVYREGSRYLNVNTGTGGNVPFRFGAWPEIALITLRQ